MSRAHVNDSTPKDGGAKLLLHQLLQGVPICDRSKGKRSELGCFG